MRNILDPSNGGMGIRLNTASVTLRYTPIYAKFRRIVYTSTILSVVGGKNLMIEVETAERITKMNARIRFDTGPARAVSAIPFWDC